MRALLLLLPLAAAGCRSAPPGTPHPDGSRPLHVGFVVTEGVYNSELMAPWDMFHHVQFHHEPSMRVFSVAPSMELVRTFEDILIQPDYTFGTAPAIDVLVVPSAENSMGSDLEDAAMMGFVRERGLEASWLMSLCDGAFVLAAAGLLDGLECTTFPGDLDAFREMFPELDAHGGVSFVHDGRAITGAGGAKSYDPALYLIELLYGARVARGVGRGMVIDWELDEVAHRVGPRAER